MRSRMIRPIGMLTAALSLAACGAFRHGSSPPVAIVVFHNQSADQADVYAVGPGGDPTRIGTVYAGRTESLRIPQSITGGTNRVNVIARIFATSRVVTTGPFTVAPGESMDVTLTSDEKVLAVLPSRGG